MSRKSEILKHEAAETVVNAAQGFEGPLGVRVEDKRQGSPKLHDLPSLQKLCSSRFGWPASKTLEVAQELYEVTPCAAHIQLLDGAASDAGDEAVEEEVISDCHRDAGDQCAGHDLAPEEDVAANEVGRHAERDRLLR